MDNPTKNRSILKSLTWISILILTILLWTSIAKALQARTSALGATQPPGPFENGQPANFDPGASIQASFFSEHNVYFSDLDTYKLILRTHRKSMHPNHVCKEQNNILQIELRRMLHNYYYVKYKPRNHRIFGEVGKLKSGVSEDPKGKNYIPIFIISPSLGKCIKDKNRILFCVTNEFVRFV
jgi:hypothetical protein